MVAIEVWTYTLVSVLLISLISLVGLFFLGSHVTRRTRYTVLLISLSAGALFGDVMLHLLPELIADTSFPLSVSFSVLGGILLFFVLEHFLHWQHCHTSMHDADHIHPFAYTNLIGDGLHNMFDGIIIATTYLVSFPAGIATTVAVLLHEIPQEIGDYGVLIHAGFSRGKALTTNFLSALMAVLGAVVTLLIGTRVETALPFLVAVTIGGFLYIAGSDLIPELHKHSSSGWYNFLHIVVFALGIALMAVLLVFE